MTSKMAAAKAGAADAGKAAVEVYLAKLSPAQRATLQVVRGRIRAAVPKGATERLAWGMPSFGLDGCLVCYAAFKNHCSLFPMSKAVVTAMLPKLGKYTTSAGTIQFPIGKPLSAGLIKAIVKARLKQRAAQREGKKRKKV